MTARYVVLTLLAGFIGGLLIFIVTKIINAFWPDLPEDLKYQTEVVVAPNSLLYGLAAFFSLSFGILLIVAARAFDLGTYTLAALFFVVALGAAWMALPGRNFLRISAVGFKYKYFWMSRQYGWSEIADIQVNTRGLLPGAISYSLKQSKPAGRFTRWFVGGYDVLPSRFGKKPSQLISLLLEFRSIQDHGHGA